MIVRRDFGIVSTRSTVLALAMATALSACAQGQSIVGATIERGTNVEYRPGSDGLSLETVARSTGAIVSVCKVDSPISLARLSTDAQSVIVSASGFLSLERLQRCGEVPLKVQMIPATGGLLQDVNLAHSLYVGLLPVTTAPIGYLAIVAKLGSSMNTISLPGALVNSQTTEQHKSQAFSYADDTGPFAMISPDGRYIAASGIVDCSPDSYPGVWDRLTHTKVVIEGGSRARTMACKNLFVKGADR